MAVPPNSLVLTLCALSLLVRLDNLATWLALGDMFTFDGVARSLSLREDVPALGLDSLGGITLLHSRAIAFLFAFYLYLMAILCMQLNAVLPLLLLQS